MATKDLKQSINLSMYQYKTIDLTTVKATDDNKCYLVDKRLVDFLLSKVTNGTLEDIRKDLHLTVEEGKTKEEIFAKLDDYIYLDKVINLLSIIEDKVAKVADNTESYD